MKDNYCELNYNRITNKWNLILKTPLINDFFENKSKSRLRRIARELAIKHKLIYYLYDKENELIEKRDYTIKNIKI